MTQKPCSSRCLYSSEGRCRLENLLGGRREVTCPHYEEDYSIMSRGRI